MLPRRQHVGEDRHVIRAGRDAARETGGDRGLGELHVRVSHNDPGTSHCLNEVSHADEHVVRLAETRAVIDDQNCFHVVLKMNVSAGGGKYGGGESPYRR